MKRCLVTVLLAASVAQASDWPFAILRSYGPYAKNRVFTDRVFAAQERHPGLFDEIWFGVDAEPFGNPDEAGARAAEGNLAAKPICERLGIRFSCQQGVTLNHDPDDQPHPDIPDDAWVVDRTGRTRRGLFCCTSPFARDHSRRKAKSIMAALRPDSYWPDDDLRILKLDWRRPGVCFCRRCLELFGREVGRAYDRETLLAELDADGAKANAATRAAWCAFNAAALDAFAKTFREAADEVSPKTRLGIQAAASGFAANGDFFPRVMRTFAGTDGRAGIRPGGGYYSDLGGSSKLLEKMVNVAREAARSSAQPCCGQVCYESENWPHIGALKSPGAMMAECSLALAVGCDSLAFYWGADQNGESTASYDFWLDTVAAWRPFHRAVRDAFRGTRLGGAAFFLGEGRWATPEWYCNEDPHLARLGACGLPITVVEASPDVYVLNERAVRTLTTNDLPKVFAKAVLTDPTALTALAKRFPSLDFPRKAVVRSLEAERALATDKRESGYERFGTLGQCAGVRHLLFPKGADVIRLSEMTADPAACGTCVLPTEFGGRTVVAQDISLDWPQQVWPGARRHGILDALDAAVPGGMPARLVTDGYAVSVTVRKAADGRTAGVLLMNFGLGETPPMDLAIRRGVSTDWTVSLPQRGSVPATVAGRTGDETLLRLPPLAPFGVLLVGAGSFTH